MRSRERSGQLFLSRPEARRGVLLGVLLGVGVATGLFGQIRTADGVTRGKESNWPQWRGPESQGVSAERELPSTWDETRNIRWKTPLPGTGFSQPVIWGNYVFLTADVEGGPAPAGHAPS